MEKVKGQIRKVLNNDESFTTVAQEMVTLLIRLPHILLPQSKMNKIK